MNYMPSSTPQNLGRCCMFNGSSEQTQQFEVSCWKGRLKARLHLQLLLRFLVRFCPFDGCERVNQTRSSGKETYTQNIRYQSHL